MNEIDRILAMQKTINELKFMLLDLFWTSEGKPFTFESYINDSNHIEDFYKSIKQTINIQKNGNKD